MLVFAQTCMTATCCTCKACMSGRYYLAACATPCMLTAPLFTLGLYAALLMMHRHCRLQILLPMCLRKTANLMYLFACRQALCISSLLPVLNLLLANRLTSHGSAFRVSGLYPLVSMVNHSCCPNSCVFFTHDIAFLRAGQNLKKCTHTESLALPTDVAQLVRCCTICTCLDICVDHVHALPTLHTDRGLQTIRSLSVKHVKGLRMR